MADAISSSFSGPLGWVRHEIRARHCRPSVAPEHCIEIIVENSEEARRASKLIVARVTPAEARKLAAILIAAAEKAKADA